MRRRGGEKQFSIGMGRFEGFNKVRGYSSLRRKPEVLEVQLRVVESEESRRTSMRLLTQKLSRLKISRTIASFGHSLTARLLAIPPARQH